VHRSKKQCGKPLPSANRKPEQAQQAELAKPAIQAKQVKRPKPARQGNQNNKHSKQTQQSKHSKQRKLSKESVRPLGRGEGGARLSLYLVVTSFGAGSFFLSYLHF
jgi:hypothetical protein